MKKQEHSLKLKYFGIDAYNEAIIFMRHDCYICRSEGFEAPARIQVTLGTRSIIVTLNTIKSDLISVNEASLSEYAWSLLGAKEGDTIFLSHPSHLISQSFILKKVYGHELNFQEIKSIIDDSIVGRLSNVQLASFLTACAGNKLNLSEIVDLTKVMIETGEQLKWSSNLVVDKHCVGGLPGNRTTLVVVPIVAAFGLTFPKTSSRAVTSPAGTADTMEVLAPVTLSIDEMRRVVAQEDGCIVWGGTVSLSPADDILIRIERVLELDSEGQLVASVLSKKIAAGSTHVVIDIPIGPTAKVRTQELANIIKFYFEKTSEQLGITLKIQFTDGNQPVGRGIGPALEARDVMSVLQCQKDAPQDLRERALDLAGSILEFSPAVTKGSGRNLAKTILDNGSALKKFIQICEAQGGLRAIPNSRYTHTISSKNAGRVLAINNRLIAKIAKLAGAPEAKAAGVDLHILQGELVEKNQPLYTIHAESSGELQYALTFERTVKSIMEIEEL